LICFEKNSIALDYPTEKTVISKRHKIYYKGKMIEAQYFVNHFKNVYEVEYNGEILYNVLMEDYSKMSVNNLVCETLHPNNIIAKLYTRKSKYSNDERDTIIMLLDNYANKKEYDNYQKVIKYC
jgi:hypothetical protein